MVDIDHIPDKNDAGIGNDAASTVLVTSWLGVVPEHNPAPDAVTPLKPTDAITAVAESPGNSTSLDGKRNKLKAQAEQSIKDPQERAKFEADMEKFEQRAAKNNPPISADEVAGTYKQVDRLLTAQDNPDSPLNVDDRRRLAEQVMSQAADQSLIVPTPDTCPASAVEKVLYARYPAEAAKVVADVGTTGKFVTPEGQTVPIDKQSIAVPNNANPDGLARSHASQIFQVTAMNTFLHKYFGTVRFEQREPAGVKDTGERLVDTSGLFLNKTVYGLGVGELDSDATAEMAYLMSGKNDIAVIRNKDFPDFEDTDKEFAQKLFGDIGGQKFESESQLKEMLMQAKNNGKLPIIMTVNSGEKPFGSNEETSSWHCITVLDYDQKTGKALIDANGLSGTQGISLDDLYHASMKVSTTEKELEQEIKQNREAGIVDTTKELELLKVHPWDISTEDYFAKQYAQILDRTRQNWDQQKQQGAFDQAGHDRVAQMALDLANQRYTYGPQKMELLQTQHKAGIISDTDYTQLIYDNIRETASQIRFEYADGNQNNVAGLVLKEFKQCLTPPEQAYLDRLLQEPR